MSFFIFYTKWTRFHFFRVLYVRKFAVVWRFGYNSVRHSLARTHLSGSAQICAHIGMLGNPQPIYRMFHSLWRASSPTTRSPRQTSESLMYEESDSGVAELQTYPWRPWLGINLCMKLARFLHSWGTFNNYLMDRATFVQHYSVKYMQNMVLPLFSCT